MACLGQNLQPVASQIAQQISSSGRKSVAVIDFTNLDGQPTKLGRFLAEEFSVALLSDAKSFGVVDRTHFDLLLQEHNLSSTGLIDANTARKLGKIVGVEALVTGTLTPFQEHVRLSIEVLDTETARMVGAASEDIPKTTTITNLLDSGDKPSSVTRNATVDGSNTASSAAAALPASVTRGNLTFTALGCRYSVSKTTCGFVAKSAAKYQAALGDDTSVEDDQGNFYQRRSLQFAGAFSGPYRAELTPNVSATFFIDVKDVPSSAKALNATLAYELWKPSNQWANPMSDTITIRGIPISQP